LREGAELRKNTLLIYKKILRPKLIQAEGFILGVGAKLFTIAGPVIVYGLAASVVYGIIYWITTLF
jgi:stage V sporulation protein AC